MNKPHFVGLVIQPIQTAKAPWQHCSLLGQRLGHPRQSQANVAIFKHCNVAIIKQYNKPLRSFVLQFSTPILACYTL